MTIIKAHLLSYLIAENNIKIYEFNRLVKDLNGLEMKQIFLLLELTKKFIVENKTNKYPPACHQS
jgi:hypothetical protein